MCRKVPYGFEKNMDGTLRPEENEAKTIRAFFEAYLAGASLADARASAGIPLCPASLRGVMKNRLYAVIVGEETLALACAEARRKNTRVNGRSGRKKQPVIPTRFRLAEGEAKTAAELYAKIIPVW